jgi:NAD(P)-dependent dehydrogenase (short-subunit alcohol dehydrogenase family)
MKATALITGGTGGLGTAVVAAFLAGGWRVVAPVRPGGFRKPGPKSHPGVGQIEADLFEPFAGAAGYITAKAAVIAFAQAVAAETTADGVRSNVVLPSIIDTPGNRAAQPGADRSTWVSSERIAEVIRFLCEAGSEPMSGATLPVYGSG